MAKNDGKPDQGVPGPQLRALEVRLACSVDGQHAPQALDDRHDAAVALLQVAYGGAPFSGAEMLERPVVGHHGVTPAARVSRAPELDDLVAENEQQPLLPREDRVHESALRGRTDHPAVQAGLESKGVPGGHPPDDDERSPGNVAGASSEPLEWAHCRRGRTPPSPPSRRRAAGWASWEAPAPPSPRPETRIPVPVRANRRWSGLRERRPSARRRRRGLSTSPRSIGIVARASPSWLPTLPAACRLLAASSKWPRAPSAGWRPRRRNRRRGWPSRASWPFPPGCCAAPCSADPP